jgi:hypothetical protein
MIQFRKVLIGVSLAAAALVALPAAARADGYGYRGHEHWHGGWRGPAVYVGPGYYAPPPVYYAPPPPPVYYAPAPVYYAPPVVGFGLNLRIR